MTAETEKLPSGPEPGGRPTLEALIIPIAVVIAAGCEPCAEKTVRRALKDGASRRQILKAIAIVEDVRGSECFRAAVGEDVRERMRKPLARARRTIEEEPDEATAGAGSSCC